MKQEQTRDLSLRAAYEFGKANGLESDIAEIRDMVIEWDLSYDCTLRRGYIVDLFEQKGLFDQFIKAHWHLGGTPEGVRNRNRYLRIKSRYEAFLAGHGSEVDDSSGEEQDSGSSLVFALEAHLRDFLAKNLERIEPGLRLYSSAESGGVEFPAEGGRIDLLAIDQNDKYVVIELKLSQGRNKALGQLLYYMGWIDRNLGKGPCRGFIIASDITEELAIAVARAPGVSLAKYRMSFAVEPVAGQQPVAGDGGAGNR